MQYMMEAANGVAVKVSVISDLPFIHYSYINPCSPFNTITTAQNLFHRFFAFNKVGPFGLHVSKPVGTLPNFYRLRLRLPRYTYHNLLIFIGHHRSMHPSSLQDRRDYQKSKGYYHSHAQDCA
jgi:hypothetical protein